jgi:SagB-type dehydrogenase family enzyme
MEGSEMNRKTAPASSLVLIFLLALACATGGTAMSQSETGDTVIKLPEPSLEGTLSVEECLSSRRSVRSYGARALTLDEASQLLWAAQGITADWGGRTTPSAGALYPLFIYVVVRNVEGLRQGSWEYDPKEHSLRLVKEGDLLGRLADAALGQACVRDARAALVITAVPEITEARYGDRSMRYIDQEVGCVCQSVYLECESLGLGTVAIGAFYDDDVSAVIGTDALSRLIMPLGPLE